MAGKQTGLGASITVTDASAVAQTISNDVTDYQFALPTAVQEVTGVDKSAIERLLLLADFSITLNGVFNTSATFSHAVFSTLQSSRTARTAVLILPNATMTATVLFTDYQIKRANTGQLTWSTPGVLSNGTAGAWS